MLSEKLGGMLKYIYNFALYDNLSFFLNFVVLIYSAYYIKPEEYASYLISMGSGQLTLSLMSLALNMYVLRSDLYKGKGWFISISPIYMLALFLFNGVVFWLLQTYYIGFQSEFIYLVLFFFLVFGINSELNEAVLMKNKSADLVARVRFVSSVVAFIALVIFFEFGLGVISLFLWLVLGICFKSVAYYFLLKNFSRYSYADVSFRANYTLMTYAALNFSVRNIESYIYPAFIGASFAGVYARASQIIQMPLKVLNGIIFSIYVPVGRKSGPYTIAIFLFVVFAMFCIAIFISNFVSIIIYKYWSSEWIGVAPILVLLSPLLVIQSAVSVLAGQILITSNDHYLNVIALINLLSVFSLVILVLNFGFESGIIIFVFFQILFIYPFQVYFILKITLLNHFRLSLILPYLLPSLLAGILNYSNAIEFI